MEEFLQLAQSKLGLSASESESSTSAVVSLIKDKMPAGDFGDLVNKIPGLGAMGEAESTAGGGGLLGGLASKASSFLGGGSDSSLGLVQKLATSGLSFDNAGSFVGLFTEFIKDKAGEGMLGKVLSSVPELKRLLG